MESTGLQLDADRRALRQFEHQQQIAFHLHTCSIALRWIAVSLAVLTVRVLFS